jgi:predicted ArsR family transcriptional regulator
MLLPVFRDLIKPQWREVLETLKVEGGLPVSEIARRLRCNYMTIKPHCDELVKAGYVVRTRVPRSEVGRPEIFYSLAAKADALFPQAGVDFTLEMLEEVRLMYGDNAPEKLLFQYFQKQFERLAVVMDKVSGLEKKALKLASLREKDGCASHCEMEGIQPLRLIELHNPLQRVFEKYPRAVMMETRMIEQLLEVKLTRRELFGGREGMPRVVFEFS